MVGVPKPETPLLRWVFTTDKLEPNPKHDGQMFEYPLMAPARGMEGGSGTKRGWDAEEEENTLYVRIDMLGLGKELIFGTPANEIHDFLILLSFSSFFPFIQRCSFLQRIRSTRIPFDLRKYNRFLDVLMKRSHCVIPSIELLILQCFNSPNACSHDPSFACQTHSLFFTTIVAYL
ncbi:hypothetical protein NE237_003840 [Protea cynaroides]|uniref:Uncharacterized protein n=1 Tax=Protea cynaroides TaxID=273540 RepID=A0A9Q0KI64_9MAGN|nr:hypothetical protein NE237_003840 [Protea cynaroides]